MTSRRTASLLAVACVALLAGCSSQDPAAAVRDHLVSIDAVSADGKPLADLPIRCEAASGATRCVIGDDTVAAPTVAGLPRDAAPAAYATVKGGTVTLTFGAVSAAVALDEARRIATGGPDDTPPPTPTSCSRDGAPFAGTVLATADRVVLMTCDATMADGRAVSPWVAVVAVPYGSSRGWALVTPDVAEQMARTRDAEAALAEQASPRPLPADAAALADELVMLGTAVASGDLPGFGVDTAWVSAWPQVRFRQATSLDTPADGSGGWGVLFAYVPTDTQVGFVAVASDPAGGCAAVELHGAAAPTTGTARRLDGPCTLSAAAAALDVAVR